MKKFSIFFLLLVIISVSGCSVRTAKYPDALTIGTENVPKTLNPYASADSANLYVTSKIYNSLLGTHTIPMDYVDGVDYFFDDGTKYVPVDTEENYYLFEDGLLKKEGAYPKKNGSKYGFEYYNPSLEEYNNQLDNKNIVKGFDEIGNVIEETQEEFEKRREESVPANDWMRYRFEVDERYTWNDGEEFNASDIVFTFKYALKYSGQLGSIAMFLTNYIDCYIEDGDFVLELATNKLSDIKTICNSIFIVPEHIWLYIDDVDSFSNLENPVGTGAYKLVEGGFITDASVALEYRDDFHEELEKEMFAYEPIKNIFLTKLANEEIMLNALNKGDIDTTLNSFTPTKINSLRGNTTYSNLEISTSPSSFVTTLAFNVGSNGIFSNLPASVREAISLSINQAELIDKYLYGEGSAVGPGLVTNGSIHALYNNGEYVHHTTNIQKANELLNDSYPIKSNGKRDLNFTILGESTSEVLIQTVASMISENLKINVSFELCTGDFAEIIKQRNNPDFDLIINSVNFEIDKILMFDARFGVYSSGEPRVWNVTGINNSTLSSLMNNMDTAKTMSEQLNYSSLVQQLIADSYVEVPLYSSMVYSIHQEAKFTGWVQSSTGTILNSLSFKYIQLNQDS